MKRIASLGQIVDGQMNLVQSGARTFLVLKHGSEVSVCGDLCPHHGAALSGGSVHGGVLTCPCHHARFDIKTGALVSPPALDSMTVYQSEITDGEILVGKPFSSGHEPFEAEQEPHFLIIGAGAAGIGCAEALRKGAFRGRITVLSAEGISPYDRTSLTTDYLAGNQEEVLLLRDPAYYTLLGIDVRLGEKAVTVDRAAKTVVTAAGRTDHYDKLLLATGAVPRPLGVPGEQLEGVHSLRTSEDADRIIASVRNTESILVVGAGFLGLEAAFSLSSIGKRVTVTAPEQHPLERPFGRAYSGRVGRMLSGAGITWRPGRMVVEFTGSAAVERVFFEEGESMDATMVVVAVGAEPAELPDGLGALSDENGLRVNGRFQTADRDIYAVGDVLGASGHAGHWVTAMRQGWYAAGAMGGGEEPYSDVPFFWSDLPGETVRAVGVPSEEDPTLEFGHIESGDFLAVWQSKGVTTGAFAVGYDAELIDIERTMMHSIDSRISI